MKIVHIMDYFAPQLGYHEKFLPKEHMKMGHDVCVITSDRHNPALYGSAAKLLLGERIKDTGFFMEEEIPTWRLKARFEALSRHVGISSSMKKPVSLILSPRSSFAALPYSAGLCLSEVITHTSCPIFMCSFGKNFSW